MLLDKFLKNLRENGVTSWLFIALLIMTAATLTGCGSAQPRASFAYEVQVFEKIQDYEPVLMETSYAKPVSIEAYQAMNKDEQEAAFITLYLESQAKLYSCNMDKAAVKAIIQKTNEAIEKYNTDIRQSTALRNKGEK